MSRSKFFLASIFLLAGILLAACGGVTGAPEVVVPTAPAISVNITSDSCPSVQIAPGTQVIWTNTDSVEHIIRIKHADSDEILIDMGTFKPGDTGAFTFIESGIYTYWCSADQTLEGTVTVKP